MYSKAQGGGRNGGDQNVGLGKSRKKKRYGEDSGGQGDGGVRTGLELSEQQGDEHGREGVIQPDGFHVRDKRTRVYAQSCASGPGAIAVSPC